MGVSQWPPSRGAWVTEATWQPALRLRHLTRPPRSVAGYEHADDGRSARSRVG